MNNSIGANKDNPIMRILKQAPIVSHYYRTRGWPYLIAWCHRLAGKLLVFYVCLHVYTLSLLETPLRYDAKMQIFSSSFFAFLEWLLAIPVIFHALNGGRLILYESFGNRKDNVVIQWLISLSVVYVVFLGILMIAANQNVSTLFFWAAMLVAALSLVYLVSIRSWHSAISYPWKLQRISGAFLLIMIPAHFIFMHLNPAAGHDAGVVIARMQSSFIKIVDAVLILTVLFHGAYGLMSITKDYVPTGLRQWMCMVLIIGTLAIFAWMGVRLVVIL